MACAYMGLLSSCLLTTSLPVGLMFFCLWTCYSPGSYVLASPACVHFLACGSDLVACAYMDLMSSCLLTTSLPVGLMSFCLWTCSSPGSNTLASPACFPLASPPLSDVLKIFACEHSGS